MYEVKPYIQPFEIKVSNRMYHLPAINNIKNANQIVKGFEELITRMDLVLKKQDNLKKHFTEKDINISQDNLVIVINPLLDAHNILVYLYMMYLKNSIKPKLYIHSSFNNHDVSLYSALFANYISKDQKNNFIFSKCNKCVLHINNIIINDSILIAKFLWETFLSKVDLDQESITKQFIFIDIFISYEKSIYSAQNLKYDPLEMLVRNNIMPKIRENLTQDFKFSLLNIENGFSFIDIYLWCFILKLKQSNSNMLLEPSYNLIWGPWFDKCFRYEPFIGFYTMIKGC